MSLELPDFDTLKNMAANDPESLERLREKHVSALIENAPIQHQTRLKGLQFQIDAQRRIHSTPMGACVKISQMMHESFSEMRCLLNDISNKKAGGMSTITEQASKSSSIRASINTSNQVLQFRSR